MRTTEEIRQVMEELDSDWRRYWRHGDLTVIGEKMEKAACGMCVSCYQREACPGKTGPSSGCDNYLAPEPTQSEWPGILREAIRDVRGALFMEDRIRRIGKVSAIKDAMIRIHGFTKDEIGEIEEGVWDD